MATNTFWDCPSSHSTCMSLILQEASAKLKVPVLRPCYLIMKGMKTNEELSH